MVNILPVDDWIEHEELTTCICEPRVEIVFIIVMLLLVLAGCVETNVNKTTNVTVLNFGDVTVRAEAEIGE